MESFIGDFMRKITIHNKSPTKNEFPISIGSFDTFIDVLMKEVDIGLNTKDIEEDIYHIYTYLMDNGFFDDYLALSYRESITEDYIFGGNFIHAFRPMIARLESDSRRIANIDAMEKRIDRVEYLRNIPSIKYSVSIDRYVDTNEVIRIMRYAIDHILDTHGLYKDRPRYRDQVKLKKRRR